MCVTHSSDVFSGSSILHGQNRFIDEFTDSLWKNSRFVEEIE